MHEPATGFYAADLLLVIRRQLFVLVLLSMWW